MANGNGVDELDNQLETSEFGSDDSDVFGDDDFDQDRSGEIDDSADLTSESSYEDAVRANPKRLSASQRKKASSVIEGVIDSAELSDERGQQKAWEKLHKKFGAEHARRFDISAEITENDVIEHPKFGIGFVVELINPTKIEVLFEVGLKKLACNID